MAEASGIVASSVDVNKHNVLPSPPPNWQNLMTGPGCGFSSSGVDQAKTRAPWWFGAPGPRAGWRGNGYLQGIATARSMQIAALSTTFTLRKVSPYSKSWAAKNVSGAVVCRGCTVLWRIKRSRLCKRVNAFQVTLSLSEGFQASVGGERRRGEGGRKGIEEDEK